MIDAYSYDRGNDFHSCGGDVLTHDTEDLAGALLLIDANIAFGDGGRGLLEVTEVVEMLDGVPHRRRYRYHFSYDSQFLFRYERDGKNHPEMPEHKHAGSEDNRIPWGRVTFAEVVEEVYEYVQDIETDSRET
jgi:hypothetical protein